MGVIQAHADALLALIRSATGSPALVVYDGKVPDPSPSPPYVLVYLSIYSPQDAAQNLTYSTALIHTDAYCHCVGADEIAARAVQQRVRGAVLDQRPAVTGRQSWPVRQVDSVPPQADESTGVAVMDAVDVYRLRTMPS